MAVPVLRGHIVSVAIRLDMPLTYARILWIIGTVIAWPVGLYVYMTGKLVLAAYDHETVSDPPAINQSGR